MRDIATKTFELILEAADNAGFDSDIDGDSLTIRQDGKIYLINYHGVTGQVWYSSPTSGAHHFAWNDNEWVSTRDDSELVDVLRRELGLSVSLHA
jgi:iron donor protein CyaY